MNKLEWKFLEEPIAVKDIEVVERKLGVKLPKDFVDVALKYHGASVTPECLDVGGIKRVFGGIHSFDESSMEYILLHCDYYKEHVNLGFIPFGRDPGGNNFCFDYSESNAEPTIIFWNHEEDIFLKVCSNFTDFLEKLYQENLERVVDFSEVEAVNSFIMKYLSQLKLIPVKLLRGLIRWVVDFNTTLAKGNVQQLIDEGFLKVVQEVIN